MEFQIVGAATPKVRELKHVQMRRNKNEMNTKYEMECNVTVTVCLRTDKLSTDNIVLRSATSYHNCKEPSLTLHWNMGYQW